MPVLLPSGMVRVTTARSLMRPASSFIWAGVSRMIPLGGAFQTSSVGLVLWHVVHRDVTIARASANVTRASDEDDGLGAGRAVSRYSPTTPNTQSALAAGNHAR